MNDESNNNKSNLIIIAIIVGLTYFHFQKDKPEVSVTPRKTKSTRVLATVQVSEPTPEIQQEHIPVKPNIEKVVEKHDPEFVAMSAQSAYSDLEKDEIVSCAAMYTMQCLKPQLPPEGWEQVDGYPCFTQRKNCEKGASINYIRPEALLEYITVDALVRYIEKREELTNYAKNPLEPAKVDKSFIESKRIEFEEVRRKIDENNLIIDQERQQRQDYEQSLNPEQINEQGEDGEESYQN